MFFIEDGDKTLRKTTLQPGDRIRVRPKLQKFFVWRPVAFHSGYSWLPVSIFRRFRRAVRLWIPDGHGGHRQWLDLPADNGWGDDLQRILEAYGRDYFLLPQILEWREEEPAYAVDNRYDYVAKPRVSS